MEGFGERLRHALNDRYRLEGVIGEGGMATVYLAHDLRHDRDVALKVLRPELAQAVGPERFLREIKITAGLNHPNILPLLDSGDADGLLYYVMPFVVGESLRERLDREGQLPLEEALRITAEVADALEFAHEQGVVHRDIKPGNILLSGRHAVVADFGIARAVTAAGAERLTQTQLAMGTPSYMSPEQMASEGPIDARSDLYSLACVLFEMLAGEPPHVARTARALVAKRLTTPAPSIGILRDGVPATVDDALTRALSTSAADRFATVGDFMRAIAEAGASRSLEPPRRRSRARGPGVVGLAALAVAATWLILSVGATESLAYSDGEWILITEFDNTTGDTILDKSLDAAFVLALQQSRLIKVFPAARIQQTLRRMTLDARTRVTDAVGREIAQREGVRYVLAPSVIGIGGRYTLGLSVLDPVLEDPVHTMSLRVGSRADLLGGLDELASRVRRTLGESRGAVQEQVPLRDVTTASLPALRQFSLASDALTHLNDVAEARRLLRNAIEIDSTFAAAHAQLGAIEIDFFDPEVGARHLSRALADVGRLTEYEATMVSGLHADLVEGDYARATAIYQSVVDLYPNRPAPHNNLGWIAWREGRLAEAAEAYRRALDIDRGFNFAYGGLNRLQLFHLGMLDSASVLARRQLTVDDAFHWAWNHLGWTLLGSDSLDAAAGAFRRAISLNGAEAEHHRGLAHSLRLAASVAEAAEALEGALRADSTSVTSRIELAQLLRGQGDEGGARRRLEEARALLERQLASSPDAADAHSLHSLVLSELGLPRLATDAAERALEASPPSEIALFNLARVEMLRGDVPAALTYLERAVSAGFADVLWMLACPELQPLRGEGRYQALVESMVR